MMADGHNPDWAHDVEVLVKHDLAAKRNEYLFPLPWPFRQACVKLLRDPRDEPLLNLLFNVALLAAVPATCLFAFNCRSHMLGLVYLLANYALFLQRFMLTLHFSEHRRLFKDSESVFHAQPKAHLHARMRCWLQRVLADAMKATQSACNLARRVQLAEPNHPPGVVHALWHPYRPLPPPPLHHAPCGKPTVLSQPRVTHTP